MSSGETFIVNIRKHLEYFLNKKEIEYLLSLLKDNNSCIAGSYPLMVLMDANWDTDLDIWVYGEENFNNLILGLLNIDCVFSKEKNNKLQEDYYRLRGDIEDVYKFYKGDFQIQVMKTRKPIEEVINNFDVRICMLAFDGEKLITKKELINEIKEDINQKKLKINPYLEQTAEEFLRTLDRMFKYYKRGFVNLDISNIIYHLRLSILLQQKNDTDRNYGSIFYFLIAKWNDKLYKLEDDEFYEKLCLYTFNQEGIENIYHEEKQDILKHETRYDFLIRTQDFQRTKKWPFYLTVPITTKLTIRDEDIDNHIMQKTELSGNLKPRNSKDISKIIIDSINEIIYIFSLYLKPNIVYQDIKLLNTFTEKDYSKQNENTFVDKLSFLKLDFDFMNGKLVDKIENILVNISHYISIYENKSTNDDKRSLFFLKFLRMCIYKLNDFSNRLNRDLEEICYKYLTKYEDLLSETSKESIKNHPSIPVFIVNVPIIDDEQSNNVILFDEKNPYKYMYKNIIRLKINFEPELTINETFHNVITGDIDIGSLESLPEEIYDYITMETTNALETYKDEQNILFMYGNDNIEVIKFTYLRQIMDFIDVNRLPEEKRHLYHNVTSDGFFWERDSSLYTVCDEHKYNHPIPDEFFVKLRLALGQFIPYKDFKRIMHYYMFKKVRIFKLIDTGIIFNRTSSYGSMLSGQFARIANREQYANYVSADHCQEGTDKKLFRIKPLKLANHD